MVIGSKNGDNL